MDWQFIAVVIILTGVVVWILYRLFSKKGRNATNGCCGCALSDACNKPKKNNSSSGKSCHQQKAR